MAKLISMFIILIAIQACLLIYHDPSPSDTGVWNFITNLDAWNSLPFILSILGIAAGIGIAGIVAASVFGFKTDFIVFAPAIAGLVSIGVVFIKLAGVVNTELASRIFTTCAIDTSCPPAMFITAITVGTIAFYYVWTVIEWWRGKDY